jgi:formylglycine-generating enzyme required for sulfatase activity
MKILLLVIIFTICSFGKAYSQLILTPAKPKKDPSKTAPVRRPPSGSSSSTPRNEKPKPEFNLLLVADSACTVYLTGLTKYTIELPDAAKSPTSVKEGEYYIEAIPKSSILLPYKNTMRVSDDNQKVQQITFNRKPIEKPTPVANLTPIKKEPRYKDTFVEELCNNLVLVEGGSFQMGDPFNSTKNEPVHPVKLNSFYMSKYEITHRQFVYFLTKTGYLTDAQKNDGAFVAEGGKRKEVNFGYDAAGKIRNEKNTHDPVLYVSWNDATEFCKWLSKETNRTFRLPTEAEWEYAARGGKQSQGLTFAGIGKPEEVAWFALNSGGETHSVGSLKPNELGLYDMSGNAWEWCADWYGEKYYRDSPEESPSGPVSGKQKVIRGGCWRSDAKQIRSIYRTSATPTESFYSIGFRITTNNP